MASTAVAGVGTIFERYNGAEWEAIAEITSIEGPTMNKDTIEVTSLNTDAGYNEFITGFAEGGQLTLGMNFTRDTYEIMKDDFELDEVKYYAIVLPDDEDTTISFSGLVIELPVNVDADDKISADVVIQISGEVTVESGSYVAPPASNALAGVIAGTSLVTGYLTGVGGEEELSPSSSAWNELAEDYTADYIAAVTADGGVIIDEAMVLSEYQRLLEENEGDLSHLHYAYHWRTGVKLQQVDYEASAGAASSAGATSSEEGLQTMVYRWYNLAPIGTTSSASAGHDYSYDATAYSTTYGADARPEYDYTNGILFRNPNLDGGVRCGLESTSTIWDNYNNRVVVKGTVKPVGQQITSDIMCKGYGTDVGGVLYIQDENASTRRLMVGYIIDTSTQSVAASNNGFFQDNVEVDFEVDISFSTGGTYAIYKNGALDKSGSSGDTSKYPQVYYQDCIGGGRNSGRLTFYGFIKQLECHLL